MYGLLLKVVASLENIVLHKENGFLSLSNINTIHLKEGLSLGKLVSTPTAVVKYIYNCIDQNNINTLDPLIQKKANLFKKDNKFKEEDIIIKENYHKFITDLVPAIFDLEMINKNNTTKKINPSSLYDGIKTLLNNQVVFLYAYFKDNMAPSIVLLRPSAKYATNVNMFREACLNYSAEAYAKFATKAQSSLGFDFDNLKDPSEVLFVNGEYLPDRIKFEHSDLASSFESILEKKVNSFFDFEGYGDLYHPEIKLSLVKQDFIDYLISQHPELVIKLATGYNIVANSLTSKTIPSIINQYRDLILHYRAQSAALEKYGLITIAISLPVNHIFEDDIRLLEENIKVFKSDIMENETTDKILGLQTITHVDKLVAIIEQALAIKRLNLDQDKKLLTGLNYVQQLKTNLTAVWLVIQNELLKQEQKQFQQLLDKQKNIPSINPTEKIMSSPKEGFLKKYYDLPIAIATFTIGITTTAILEFVFKAPLALLLSMSLVATLVIPLLFKLIQLSNRPNNKSTSTTKAGNKQQEEKITKKIPVAQRSPEKTAIKDILYGTAIASEPNIIIPEEMIAGLKKKMISRLQRFPKFKGKPASEVLNFINSITTIIDIPYHTNGNIARPSKFKNKGPLKLFYIGSKLDQKTTQEIIATYENYFKERIPSEMKPFLEAHLKKLLEYNGGN